MTALPLPLQLPAIRPPVPSSFLIGGNKRKDYGWHVRQAAAVTQFQSCFLWPGQVLVMHHLYHFAGAIYRLDKEAEA